MNARAEWCLFGLNAFATVVMAVTDASVAAALFGFASGMQLAAAMSSSRKGS